MSKDSPVRSIIDPESTEQQLSRGTSYLLGIGIDNYVAFPRLNNAVKDVADFHALLSEHYKLDEGILLFNEEATRENIIRQLDQLSEMIIPGDRLIIYYSGHGHLNKRKRGFWIPFDAEQGTTSQYIANSRVRDYLSDIESTHTLLISDACFSGSLFVRGPSRSAIEAHKDLEKKVSRWALCSGRHDEVVADGPPGENSPFARSILQTLKQSEVSSINIAQLTDQVTEQTRSNYEQLPEGGPVYGVGHEGGQYIFHRSIDESIAWKLSQDANALEAYLDFVKKYPDSKYKADALQKIELLEEDRFWEKASSIDDSSYLFLYIKSYPKGKYRDKALEQIYDRRNELRSNSRATSQLSSYHSKRLRWLSNTKSRHVLSWVIVLVVFTYFSVDESNPISIHSFVVSIINVLLYMVLIYGTLMVLIPKFLKTGRILLFGVSVLVFTIIVSPLKILILYFLFSNDPAIQQGIKAEPDAYFLMNFIIIGGTTIYYITREWTKSIREERIRELEEIENQLYILNNRIE